MRRSDLTRVMKGKKELQPAGQTDDELHSDLLGLKSRSKVLRKVLLELLMTRTSTLISNDWRSKMQLLPHPHCTCRVHQDRCSVRSSRAALTRRLLIGRDELQGGRG